MEQFLLDPSHPIWNKVRSIMHYTLILNQFILWSMIDPQFNTSSFRTIHIWCGNQYETFIFIIDYSHQEKKNHFLDRWQERHPVFITLNQCVEVDIHITVANQCGRPGSTSSRLIPKTTFNTKKYQSIKMRNKENHERRKPSAVNSDVVKPQARYVPVQRVKSE